MITAIELTQLVSVAACRVRATATPAAEVGAMVRELAALPGAVPSASLGVRCDEFEVTLGQLDYHEQTISVLESIRSLGLVCAPDVVECIPFSEHRYDGVLVVRYAACPGERLVRAKATTAPFRADAAKRFIAEMDLLAARGKVHPYARGLTHWLVSSETGTLLLESWSVLRDASEGERKEMGEIIREIIQERGTS